MHGSGRVGHPPFRNQQQVLLHVTFSLIRKEPGWVEEEATCRLGRKTTANPTLIEHLLCASHCSQNCVCGSASYQLIVAR